MGVKIPLEIEKNAEIFQNHLPNALRQLNGHEHI